jgi:hypothetical protein
MLLTKNGETTVLRRYPNETGVWSTEVDGESIEIEVVEHEGKLVVHCDELDEVGIDISQLEECEDDCSLVLASSLAQDDGEAIWEFIE